MAHAHLPREYEHSHFVGLNPQPIAYRPQERGQMFTFLFGDCVPHTIQSDETFPLNEFVAYLRSHMHLGFIQSR